jgi:serine/threonine-protein kinase RsbW
MSPRESYPNSVTLRWRGSDAIGPAVDAARDFSAVKGLTHDDGARLCILVEELVANLYDHGGLTEEHEIEINLIGEPGQVRLILTDPGKPFDPRQAPPKQQPPERGGGAGIDIVRAWAQFVDYTVTPEGNRLELVLPI